MKKILAIVLGFLVVFNLVVSLKQINYIKQLKNQTKALLSEEYKYFLTMPNSKEVYFLVNMAEMGEFEGAKLSTPIYISAGERVKQLIYRLNKEEDHV